MSNTPTANLLVLMVRLSDLIAAVVEYRTPRLQELVTHADPRTDRADCRNRRPDRLLARRGPGARARGCMDARSRPRGLTRRGGKPLRTPRRRGRLVRLAPRRVDVRRDRGRNLLGRR